MTSNKHAEAHLRNEVLAMSQLVRMSSRPAMAAVLGQSPLQASTAGFKQDGEMARGTCTCRRSCKRIAEVRSVSIRAFVASPLELRYCQRILDAAICALHDAFERHHDGVTPQVAQQVDVDRSTSSYSQSSPPSKADNHNESVIQPVA